MSTNWQQTAHLLWTVILEWAQTRKSEGWTLQQIDEQVGVGNKSVVAEWLKGNRKAENAPFSVLMECVENIGLDYRDYFPDAGSRTSIDKKAVAELEERLEALKHEYVKALCQVELLKEQLANAQRSAISNCVTQTVNGDKNRAVISAENREG